MLSWIGNSVEGKPCIDKESKILEINIYLYLCVDEHEAPSSCNITVYLSKSIVLEQFCVQQHLKLTNVHKNPANNDVFNPFFSNYIKYHAAATAANSKCIISLLKGHKIICADLSTIWDDTYVCDEKYIFTTELYLLLILSHACNIIIRGTVGVIGHGI